MKVLNISEVSSLMQLGFQVKYAAATTFPSSEYADEKAVRPASLSNPEGMAPSGPPVWRSQLMSSHPQISVKRRPSGEKLSCESP